VQRGVCWRSKQQKQQRRRLTFFATLPFQGKPTFALVFGKPHHDTHHMVGVGCKGGRINVGFGTLLCSVPPPGAGRMYIREPKTPRRPGHSCASCLSDFPGRTVVSPWCSFSFALRSHHRGGRGASFPLAPAKESRNPCLPRSPAPAIGVHFSSCP